MTEIEQLWEMIDAVTQRSAGILPAMVPGRGQEARAPLLAEDIRAPMDLPPFDHSAMDGYAFADLKSGWHPISCTLAAGEAVDVPLQSGRAARVLTGAPIPSGTLFVAKQEDCEVKEGKVRFRPSCPTAAGTHIRKRGSAIKAGEIVLCRGSRLNPGSVALLAALGIDNAPLLPQLTALHIATGDELIPPGQPLLPGKIYDSNGPMIEALLHDQGVDCQRLRVADNLAALQNAVRDFAGNVLLISGGSGPGDRDHTHNALESQGYIIHASSINSRPGKPLIFATRGTQVAFGLPGNPLSHFVCFHAFVARAIARMQGQKPPSLIPVYLEETMKDSGDGRRTWTPARVSWSTGQLRAVPLRWAHSGDLRSLAEANALLLDGTSAMLTFPIL